MDGCLRGGMLDVSERILLHIPVITNEVNIATRRTVRVFDERKSFPGGSIGREENEGSLIASVQDLHLLVMLQH